MKFIATFVGVLFLVFVLGGYVVFANYGEAGSGINLTEERKVDTFDRISLVETGTVNVTFGDEVSVFVTTDDNLVQLVETTVKDGELTIQPTKALNPSAGLVIDIVMPKLTKAELAGAAVINIEDIETDSLEIELAGACGVTASGTVSTLKVELAGACRASMKELKAETAKVEIDGTGNATVYASESLNASANGFASITCHGNPTDVKKEANGISKVTVVGS